MTKVVVALSGGVDSSVAAALLVRQGFDVEGVTMRLWSAPGCENENRCCTPETRLTAQNLADGLHIPFTVLDAQDLFRKQVVQPFLDGYSRGDTPNPCIFCNRYLKWGQLLDYARTVNADFIATGHYAKITKTQNGNYELRRGADETKDQSYFLSLLTQSHLSRTLFPLADLHKSEVRQIAHDFDLPAADQPESQDLCFVGNRNYGEFLAEFAPEVVNPGEIRHLNGSLLGKHEGLAFYTIGQRKRLPASSQALYVVDKDMAQNCLIVGGLEDLGKQNMIVPTVNWILGAQPEPNFLSEIKIRSNSIPKPAQVNVATDGTAQVTFYEPIRDITPGQMAVFYDGDLVLGGGIIEKAF